MKTAIINEATNEVVNVIELERDAVWEAPFGYFVKFSETAAIGMFWDGESFANHNPAEI